MFRFLFACFSVAAAGSPAAAETPTDAMLKAITQDARPAYMVSLGEVRHCRKLTPIPSNNGNIRFAVAGRDRTVWNTPGEDFIRLATLVLGSHVIQGRLPTRCNIEKIFHRSYDKLTVSRPVADAGEAPWAWLLTPAERVCRHWGFTDLCLTECVKYHGEGHEAFAIILGRENAVANAEGETCID